MQHDPPLQWAMVRARSCSLIMGIETTLGQWGLDRTAGSQWTVAYPGSGFVRPIAATSLPDADAFNSGPPGMGDPNWNHGDYYGVPLRTAGWRWHG